MKLSLDLGVSKAYTLNNKICASRVFATFEDKKDNNVNIMELIFCKLKRLGCSMLPGFRVFFVLLFFIYFSSLSVYTTASNQHSLFY